MKENIIILISRKWNIIQIIKYGKMYHSQYFTKFQLIQVTINPIQHLIMIPWMKCNRLVCFNDQNELSISNEAQFDFYEKRAQDFLYTLILPVCWVLWVLLRRAARYTLSSVAEIFAMLDCFKFLLIFNQNISEEIRVHPIVLGAWRVLRVMQCCRDHGLSGRGTPFLISNKGNFTPTLYTIAASGNLLATFL